MKHLLALLALSSAAPASAVGWQYATLTLSGNLNEWTLPDGTSKTGKDLSEVITKIGCKGRTYTQFFNCVGNLGWELSLRYETSKEPFMYEIFVFKKMK